MQNNVTELTQRLLRALDSNYNVIDMPSVIEIISLLEKVAITKELLETTRLGKHVNELRRNTTNESLAKRAKELVKKWRSMVLPESNGQLLERKRSAKDSTTANLMMTGGNNNKSIETVVTGTNVPLKRPRINGQVSEFDFSDNSNSSFKDVIGQNTTPVTELKRDVIIVNSDSNSSLPSGGDPQLDQQIPKKRGRKKGSKNHKSLLDEAETSFTNKMAVSRGNAKVKTTQELIASLQNKNSTLPPLKPIEDLNERAAKLTERVSIIDQKLNTNANRYKNSQRKKPILTSDRIVESGSVINIKSESVKAEEDNNDNDDEEVVVVVDDMEASTNVMASKINPSPVKAESEAEHTETTTTTTVTSLSVEEALAKLPPIDHNALFNYDDVEGESAAPVCTCELREKKTDEDLFPVYEIEEDHTCSAHLYLQERYHLGEVTEERVHKLHSEFIPNVNGNLSIGSAGGEPILLDNGLFVDVVPKVNNECLPKDPKPCENYKKYSISEERTIKSDDGEGQKTTTFREWHEIVETTSYDGEILKILPYCIID